MHCLQPCSHTARWRVSKWQHGRVHSVKAHDSFSLFLLRVGASWLSGIWLLRIIKPRRDSACRNELLRHIGIDGASVDGKSFADLLPRKLLGLHFCVKGTRHARASPSRQNPPFLCLKGYVPSPRHPFSNENAYRLHARLPDAEGINSQARANHREVSKVRRLHRVLANQIPMG